MSTNSTQTPTPTPRAARTYLNPEWHVERDIWTAATIEELRDRLKHQEAPTRLETLWELASVHKSRKGDPAAIVVKRNVYCDPPWIDPLLVSIHRKYGQPR